MAEYNPIVNPNQEPIQNNIQQVDPLTGRPSLNITGMSSPFTQQQMNLPKPALQVNPNDFRQKLMQDIAGTQQNVAKQQSQLGVIAPQALANLGARGTKIGDRLVAQKETADYKKYQTEAITQLTRASGFADQATQAIFANELQKKFDKIQQDLTRRALQFDYNLKKQGLDEEQRRKAAGMWGNLAGTLVGGIIGGYFGGPAGAVGGSTAGGAFGGAMGQSVQGSSEEA